MPSTLNIPAHTEFRCAPCEFHKCIGSFHVRVGPGGYREYACMHPEAEDFGPMPLAPEQAARIGELRARFARDGRWIGRTEKQPQWCPLKRGGLI